MELPSEALWSIDKTTFAIVANFLLMH